MCVWQVCIWHYSTGYVESLEALVFMHVHKHTRMPELESAASAWQHSACVYKQSSY